MTIDVFDTALYRMVRDPRDVYLLAAWRLCARSAIGIGFAELAAMREAAEQDARIAASSAGLEEITLDDIFALLSSHISRSISDSLKNEEIATEEDICFSNPDILALYEELLRRGLRIGFVSDTAHSAEFVDRLLRKAGFSGSHTTYTSSQFQAAKATGNLYTKLTAYLGMFPGDIWHIGDHPHSDVINASLKDFNGLWYRPSLRARFFVSRKVRDAAGLTASLASGISSALCRDQEDGSRVLERIGVRVAGPVYLAFTQWLCAQLALHPADHLYFFARDGRIIHRVYELLRAAGVRGPDSSYLFVSRRSLVFPEFRRIDDRELDFLCSYQLPLPVHQFLSRVGLDPNACAGIVAKEDLTLDTVIQSKSKTANLRRVFLQLEGDLLRIAGSERVIACEYLRSEGCMTFQTLAVCDIGWHGTMQAALRSLLAQAGHPSTVAGYYVATSEGVSSNLGNGASIKGWLSEPGAERGRRMWIEASIPILELLFTAVHGSVIGYSKTTHGIKPQLRSFGVATEYIAAAELIQDSALRFVRRYVSAFGGTPPIGISETTAVSALRRLATRPSRKEARTIGDLIHIDGFGATERGQPIARPQVTCWWKSGTFDAFKESFSRSPWPHGFLVRSIGSAKLAGALVRFRQFRLRRKMQ